MLVEDFYLCKGRKKTNIAMFNYNITKTKDKNIFMDFEIDIFENAGPLEVKIKRFHA